MRPKNLDIHHNGVSFQAEWTLRSDMSIRDVAVFFRAGNVQSSFDTTTKCIFVQAEHPNNFTFPMKVGTVVFAPKYVYGIGIINN